VTADPAPRLAQIREKYTYQMDARGYSMCPDEDVAYLLDVSEKAAALMEALRSESIEAFEHDLDARRVTQQIWTWVNGYPDFDDRPLYDALTALSEALETT
jgi:hypothetical protein